MNLEDTITINATPYNLPLNFARYCVIKTGAGVINLPNPLQSSNSIVFSNVSSATPVAIKFNGNTITTIPIGAFNMLTPDASNIPIGAWLVTEGSSGDLLPGWLLTGNAGTTGAILGTTDNSDFSIQRNGFPYLTFQAQQTKIDTALAFNTTTATSLANIYLKQINQCDNNRPAAFNSIYFENSGSAAAYYMGYSVGGTLGVFKFTPFSTYTRIFEFSDVGAKSFFGYDANNNKVINVANPSAAQDSATKAYVDAIPTTLAPLVPLLTTQTSSKSGWVASASSVFAGSFAEAPWQSSESIFWAPVTATGEFLEILLSTAGGAVTGQSIIGAVQIRPRVGSPNITSFVLSGMNGASATPLFTASGAQLPIVTGNLYSFRFTNTQAFTRYRFTFNFANVTNSGVNFLQIFGTMAPA